MRHSTWKPIILALAAFSLTAMIPLSVSAQDHQDDHHDQKAQDHQDDHSAMRRDDHHDENRPDPAAQYRHDHPHSSARCHDGFFTSTHDRSRACTKHGGIDVWLTL
jgi:ABC-type nickel/cobalt efflux system permease component RcnA